jgi:FdhD protein
LTGNEASGGRCSHRSTNAWDVEVDRADEIGGGMNRVVSRREVTRILADERVGAMDSLAVEEPLEIRIGGAPLSITMRTPGHDMDLCAGFLVGEGVIQVPEDLMSIRYCAGAVDGVNTYNVLDVVLGAGVAPPNRSLERSFYTTSSCGVCGKASIEALRIGSRYDLREDPMTVLASRLLELPARLRRAQGVFDQTGGLHAAGLYDVANDELRVVREDVGRHNAVDKVVGWALREGLLPLRNHVLVVSGRASFELTQKAAMAGIPMLAAVSAPSSLAVDLAEELGMALVGFLRSPSMVAYAGVARILPDPTAGEEEPCAANHVTATMTTTPA